MFSPSDADTKAYVSASTRADTAQLQHHRGLTAGSSKLERINLVGKWSLIGDRNQAAQCVCVYMCECVSGKDKEKHARKQGFRLSLQCFPR